LTELTSKRTPEEVGGKPLRKEGRKSGEKKAASCPHLDRDQSKSGDRKDVHRKDAEKAATYRKEKNARPKRKRKRGTGKK